MRKKPVTVYLRFGFFALSVFLLLPLVLHANQKTSPQTKKSPTKSTQKKTKKTPQVKPPTVKKGKSKEKNKPVTLAAPTKIEAKDHPFDNGEKIDVIIGIPEDESESDNIKSFLLERCEEQIGNYVPQPPIILTDKDREKGFVEFTVEGCVRGEEYYFRVRSVGDGGVKSDLLETADPTIPSREWFAGDRFFFLLLSFLVCGSVAFFIRQARKGKPVKIRKIAGLEAVEEAVGRATEMGRPVLFITGIQDMNDVQTIAGLTVLSRVSQVAAEYGARIEVPTSRSLVMTAARETVESSFLAAGKPDEYNEDDIYYVTDEQFGFVAYLSGMMVREKPAACFYMGSFYAESLILAETGNSIGAIQVAGTAMPAQLPFFVAACDYTLIGEEFFAASAYLSGDNAQLGSLKGQDLGKAIAALIVIIGCAIATVAAVTDNDSLKSAKDYITKTLLKK